MNKAPPTDRIYRAGSRILRTKLHRPQLTAESVVRDRLITVMNTGPRGAADPGVGPGRLRQECPGRPMGRAARLPRRLVVVGCQRRRAEGHSSEYFLAAVDTVSPGACDATRELLACRVPGSGARSGRLSAQRPRRHGRGRAPSCSTTITGSTSVAGARSDAPDARASSTAVPLRRSHPPGSALRPAEPSSRPPRQRGAPAGPPVHGGRNERVSERDGGPSP